MFLLDLWELYGKPSRQLGETLIISMWGFLVQHIIVLSCGILELEGLIFLLLLTRGLSLYIMNNFLCGGRGEMGYFMCFKNCFTWKGLY